jgi:hypothetical protein
MIPNENAPGFGSVFIFMDWFEDRFIPPENPAEYYRLR